MYLSTPIHSSLPSESSEISQLFYIQIQQLAQQIPILQAKIIYTEDATIPQVVTYQGQGYESIRPWGSGYPIEHWVDEDFLQTIPPLRLTVIQQKPAIAICKFGRQGAYLLLCTRQRISPSQQVVVERQMQILEHYWQMHLHHLRQRSEIQLLEQVLQKAEHQIRSPLALMSLYAENLYLGSASDEQKQQIALIRETAANLTDSVTNLLACGQQAKIRIANHNLLDILQSAIADLQPWIREKQIHICVPESPLHVPVDGWQMQQVFHNILHNAVQFTPAGGTITCHWQAFQHEVVMTIADQGAGLSDADLQQIFTPFYSRRPGGTGLGLTIAKKILLDHQGNLWADNLPQGGAQFSMTLPNQS